MQRWNVLIDLAVIVLVMNRISIARAAFLIAGKRIVTSRRTIEVPNRAVLLDNNHRSGWRCLTAVSLPSSRIDIAAIKPMSRPFKLVIVESPSKCATISKILSHYVEENDLDFDFVVTASMGHIRNLPKSANKNEIIAGVDVHNQYKPTYEIIQGKQGLVRDLQLLSSDSQCQQVILAMDEDREGEAIAWHIAELLPKASHVRITFTEITPKAILEAIQSPRDINMNLVDAQETRRILDRLAGYTLSPLLWKKIAPGLSAGRVQSVGMALIVQRERQRLNFVRARYWDLAATFESNNVTATLVQVNGQAIASGSDFSNLGHLTNLAKLHLNEEAADDVLISMSGGEMNAWLRDPNASNWTVESLQTNRRTTNPPVAFTTSTLQQEAVRKLGLSVSQTMRVAQALYEAGFITYMRTDSSSMSEDAQKATATSVASRFGTDLVMPPRQAAKSRNAQEAHEAIRPTIQQSGDFLAPNDISSSNEAERRIYKLIYERTIASRMKPQILNSTLVDIKGVSPDGSTVLTFRVTGSVVVSPGYTLAYSESDEVEQFIPDWSKGQHISCDGLYSVSHETKPPPRYTEASFVKKLEEIGVGRPSTYANTLEILRERSYVGTPLKDDDVGIKQRRSRSGTAISAQRAAGGEEFTGGGRGPLVPSLSAFVVCSLLENHLPLYVNETFTAGMEAKLDLIAQGLSDMERNDYLEEFYGGEDGLAAKVQHIEQSVDADEVRRANLPTMAGEEDIALMIGPWGPYIQKLNTSSVPDEKPMTAQLPPGMASDLSTITKASLTALLESRENDGVFIGYHPDSREIYLKTGRYGLFLQTRRRRGEEEDVSNHSLPKRIASMRNLDLTHAGEKGEAALSEMIGLTFEEAVGYVDLPRTVATLDGLDIICGLGPYGGYLKYNNTYVSLRKSDGDLLTLDSETAREIIKSRMLEKKTGLRKGVISELGEMDGSIVSVKEGRFGPYINHRRVNVNLPSDFREDPSSISLMEAWSLIQEKASSGRRKNANRGKGRDTVSENIVLPPAPKRPKSAFLFFCNDKRLEVSKTTKSLGEISKELSRLWALTVDDQDARQIFEDLARKEKEEYMLKKKKWEQECQRLIDEASVSSGKQATASSSARKPPVDKKDLEVKIDIPKPKRPKSSYLFFCAEHRPSVSREVKSLGEISKELARLWAEAAGTDQRKKYEDMASADKIRYEIEMEEYNQARLKGEVDPGNGSIAGGQTAQKSDKMNHRARSAYMIFCSKFRNKIMDDDGNRLGFGETTKRLAQMWKDCDELKKAEFEAEAAKERLQTD